MPTLAAHGRSSYRQAGVFLGAFLFCTQALADPDTHNFRDFLNARETNGSITGVSGCKPGSFNAACVNGKAGDPVSTGINANIGWRVGMLAGQPLVELAMNWTPTDLRGMLPAGYQRADPGLVAGLDEKANAKLSLYAVDVAIGFQHEGRSYTITEGVGVPAAPGNESSFNVPASYEWNGFIKDASGNFVDAQTAKAIVKAGIKPTGAAIVQAKVNTFDLQTYWYDKNVDRYNAPLREAVESQLLLLEDTFGLPVDEIRVALATYEAEHSPQEVNRKLASMFERLTPANLPEKYLGAGLARDIKLSIYADALGGIDGRLRLQMNELPPLPGHDVLGHQTWLDEQKAMFRTRELRLALLREDVREAQHIENEIAEAKRREERRREEERAEREREKVWEFERRAEARERREAKARARYRDVNRPYGESDGGWNGITANILSMTQQMYGNSYGGNGYSGTYYGGGNYSSSSSSCAAEDRAYERAAAVATEKSQEYQAKRQSRDHTTQDWDNYVAASQATGAAYRAKNECIRDD